MKTLYDLLDVSRQASISELGLAYRRQLELQMRAARLPLGRAEQQRLRALREAFLLLSIPARRAEYDIQLEVRVQRQSRLLRRSVTLASAVLVVAGFAMIGGAWYQQAVAGTPSATVLHAATHTEVQTQPQTGSHIADSAQRHSSLQPVAGAVR